MCLGMWLLLQHRVQPRHVSNLQNPVCFALVKQQYKAEKMMRVVFSPLLHTPYEKDEEC